LEIGVCIRETMTKIAHVVIVKKLSSKCKSVIVS
jgi:hypothetical protein